MYNKSIVYNIMKIDYTSTLVGFSAGMFLAYLFYNKPECITKLPNSDICASFKKQEVPCTHDAEITPSERDASAQN